MQNEVVAIIDGALFDSFIEFRNIMVQSDEHLKTVRFINKDRLSEAKASGDFISAPLAFIVAPINNKETYIKELEEAQRIKNEFEISACNLIFAASGNDIFSDNVKDMKAIGYEIFDLVYTLHIIHEDYQTKEEMLLKILALISGLVSNCISEDDVGFKKDYMLVTMSINYRNLCSTFNLIFEKLKEKVKKINKEITELNEEIQLLTEKKSKKYLCNFSSRSYSDEKENVPSVPAKPDEMLLFCRTYSSTLSRASEEFQKNSESDIITAQNALSKTFDYLTVKDEVNVDVLNISAFEEGESPYESQDLIKRAFNSDTPQIHKVSGLIPLLKTIANAENLDAKTGIKIILSLIGGVLLAIAAYVVPTAIKTGTAIFTNTFIGVLAGIPAMILLGSVIALLISFCSKLKLKNYIKSLVRENSHFLADKSKTDSLIREYINKFVTVSVNSFIKTKKIDIALSKINDLKKQKKQIVENAKELESKLAPISALQQFYEDYPEVAGSAENIEESIRCNSETESSCYCEAPEIDCCMWLSAIQFESPF